MPEYSKTQQLRKKPKPKKVVEYKQATEAARAAEGFLVCADCGRGLLDHEAFRHHIRYRSQLGDSSAQNLKILCLTCHEREHAHR